MQKKRMTRAVMTVLLSVGAVAAITGFWATGHAEYSGSDTPVVVLTDAAGA
ncbi:hypothetical protein [Streptomyces sp. TLI_105]|uniref:hypothetical protein n=1 Tax=Streptomyces sp. TLI_105 TaxID=1881019 RepID=UPI00089A852A|nr:hypothetical protein [Streptomyces sp. TLI_105]SEE59462.1 hypothetical protein SAMN05428939_8044 [Streptomyces sp. TLI_105]